MGERVPASQTTTHHARVGGSPVVPESSASMHLPDMVLVMVPSALNFHS